MFEKIKEKEAELRHKYGYSKRLPEEKDITDYINLFKKIDLSDSKYTIQHIIEKSPDNCPVNVRDMWPGISFRDPGLKPEVTQGTISSSSISNTILLPKSFVRQVLHSASHGMGLYNSKHVSNFRILMNLGAEIQRYILRSRDSQKELFVQALQRKEYFSRMTEAKIAEEISLRRKQYPGRPIYVVLGSSMFRTFDSLHRSNVFHGAYLLTNLTSRYSAIHEWESAIIAEGQVKTSFEFDVRCALERIPRKWRTEYGVLCKYSVEVDDHSSESKVIAPRGLNRFTFE
jgi:hypothetical protein